ncbi:expressed unknown protein [Seminavis robusta]|uniref:Uncharacterized protein n=1 Tax=Seminavis robusta TaxID=568900 RepID=A0A9N8H3C3_9STRA|nr:expressed unknown protein [Seminavis robusta]|eukprot:Sro35_g022600.1 n/a (1034) ;mRNA; f:136141-139602
MLTAPIYFDRPVGATADVAELEFISALMQTEKLFLRQDGSLTARDIHFYLKSRHGVRVPVEKIEQDIICQMACVIRPGGKQRNLQSSNITTKNGVANTSTVKVDAGRSTTGEFFDCIMEDEELQPPPREYSHQPKAGAQQNKGMSKRVMALRVSQAISHDDYEKYKQYQHQQLKLIREENDDNGSTDDTDADDTETEELKMNLVRIASLILIPKLRQARVDADKGLETDEVDVIDVFLAILMSETGLKYDQELTRDVLLHILSFGEKRDKNDSDEYIDSLMETALASHPDARPRLNKDTMLRVLTDDIEAYDVDLENTKETTFEEVNAMEGSDESKLRRIYTAGNIDANADTYRSKTWTIASWYAIVVILLAYLFNGVSPNYQWQAKDCTTAESQVGCAITVATLHWLEVFVSLSIVGFPFLFLANLGNSVYLDRNQDKSKVAALICVAMFSTALYVFLPFFYRADFWFFHSDPTSIPPEENDGSVQPNNSAYLGPVSLLLGCFLLCVQMMQLMRLTIPGQMGRSCKNSASTMRAAFEWKKAANMKVDRAVLNAVRCHVDTVGVRPANWKRKSSIGRSVGKISTSITRYNQSFTKQERAGGILWTWRKIRDRTLFYEEGIYIWPRLVASNIAQWTAVLIIAGVFAFGLSVLTKEEEVAPDLLSNEKFILVLAVGFPPAFFAAISTSLLYVPSAVSSILKYRCGELRSLDDRRFLQNRFAMDSANLLFGAAFWTCLCSAAAFYALFSVFTFLCLYVDTQQMMIRFTANCIGMLITMILKQVLMLFIRSRWSRGYYRSRPAIVNISNTIQEVWNLGLTTFTALVRGLKFMAIFLLYLGRIDREVFAPGVGWFRDDIPLDGLPHCFARDLLIHEAHRHPLIERLGLLFMIKLRKGSDFGTRGGAAWRMAFTGTLMPWLRKYGGNLGAVWNNSRNAEEQRSALSGLSKDALVENLMVLEQNYKQMAEQMKNIGNRTRILRPKAGSEDQDDTVEADDDVSGPLLETYLKEQEAGDPPASTPEERPVVHLTTITGGTFD